MTGQQIYDLDRAAHPFRATLLDEHCAICGALAAHEVAEVANGSSDETPGYLCCPHFSWIFFDCAPSPPNLPVQRDSETAP